MNLFNFYKDFNQLNLFKLSLSNQEFIFIYNMFKTLSFIQIYNYFKIIEKKLKLKNLCLISLTKLLDLKIYNNFLIFKNLFLINCIQLIKNKFLLKNYYKFLNLFLNLTNLPSSYRKINFLKYNFKQKNFLICGEVYKNYKGSIIPFNISKLSWFVRSGLKLEEN